MKSLKYSFLFIVVVFTVMACTTNYQAPVQEVGASSVNNSTDLVRSNNRSSVNTYSAVTTGNHQVSRGETLIAIAFRYDLEYTALARVNGIDSPYVIFPGQILELDTSKAPPPSKKNNAEKVYENSANVANNSRARSTGTGSSSPIMSWSWPASGKVIGGFSNQGTVNKGIDIAGKKGDTVIAAEAGEVVYAGNALLHYGDLLIIKHNERFLSAYAHNSKLLVTEGDQVVRGQKVATLGATGVDKEMLHFEIRQNGTPVDPLLFLPPR